METPVTYPVQIVKHNRSDLLMVLIPEVPGFILHAYSDDEVEQKLGPAFKAYMNATVKDEAEARRREAS